MAIIAFLFAALALGLDLPQENKAEKFNACYSLVKLKFSRDQEQIDSVLSTFETEKDLKSYYTAEMLLKCYTSISLDTAETIIKQGEELVLVTDFEELIEVNLEGFKDTKNLKNPDHKLLYEDIKHIKEEAERKDEEIKRMRRKIPPLFSAGPLYILGVLVVFGLILYFGAKKVLWKPAKAPKNKKKQ